MSALSDVQRVDAAAVVLAYAVLANQRQKLTRIPLDGLVADAFQVFAEAVEAMEKEDGR